MTDRPPITHRLKCESEYFYATKWGEKMFEVRIDDRDYRKHDFIELVRCVKGVVVEPGEEIRTQISFVLRGFRGVKRGWAVLGIERMI